MDKSDPISGEDLASGRLLAGLTTHRLGKIAGVSHDTVSRLESGRPVRLASRRAVTDALVTLGITFRSAGFVFSRDGTTAPTVEFVGRLHGGRIRRARWHL